MRRIGTLFLLLALTISTGAFAKTTITIINGDAPKIGFNDPTPVAPVGGNNGTTLGEQRLNAFRAAADIWAGILDSEVEIKINASFADLDCTATSAVLGQARTAFSVKDFPNAPVTGVLYPAALASKLARTDLANGGAHILAQFNTFTGSGCAFKWYYGLDGNHGSAEDLVVVLLHEFGHGLGFAGNVDAATGKYRSQSVPSIFDTHVFDEVSGLRFDQMSVAQRMGSGVNDQHLLWDGMAARQAAAKLLGPTSSFAVSSPSSIAGSYSIRVASWGSPITVAGVNGNVVAGIDAIEPADTTASPAVPAGTATDGCSPLSNASAVTGRVVLVDRGRCTFVTKAHTAQDAGAIGIIIADNSPTGLPPLGGTDTTIRIPVIGISQADGATIRQQVAGGVSARIFADTLLLAGASRDGLPKLYAPLTVESGSSLYHWDVSATPNLLMEPAISADLKHDVDLTLYQLLDIGWTLASTSGVTPVPNPTPSGRRVLRRGK